MKNVYQIIVGTFQRLQKTKLNKTKRIINYIKFLASLPTIVEDLEDENQELRSEITRLEKLLGSELEDVRLDIRAVTNDVEGLPSEERVERLIESAVEELDLSQEVEKLLEQADLSDQVSDALCESKELQRAIDSAFGEAIEDYWKQSRIDPVFLIPALVEICKMHEEEAKSKNNQHIAYVFWFWFLSVYCPDCNKFVSMDTQEPEVNNIDIEYSGEGKFNVTCEGRTTRNCAECGNELKALDWMSEDDVDVQLNNFTGWDKLSESQQKKLLSVMNDHDVCIEEEGTEVDESGVGRYAKNMITSRVYVKITIDEPEGHGWPEENGNKLQLVLETEVTSTAAASEFEEQC